MTRLAGSLSLTACALLLSIGGANALTAEQEAIVKKYNINAADQKKLFASAPAAAGPAQSSKSARVSAAPAGVYGPSITYGSGTDNWHKGWLNNTYVWAGGDAYKAIGDRVTNIAGGPGELANSFGAVGGFNTSFGVGDFPIRLQAGASYGEYDFRGRLAIVPQSKDREKQSIYTVGLYTRGDALSQDWFRRFSAGVVYDSYRADNWGVNANNIELSQLRGIVGYALTASTEVGVWGTAAMNDDRAAVTVAGAPGVRRTIHAMNQGNVYLKHNFDYGSQITAYVGTLSGADIGNWQAGLIGQVPLSPNWAAYGNLNYVTVRAPVGAGGSGDETWNVSFGLSYYFGGNAASSSVTGNRGLPLLPVANNGSFLITD